jgi:hypothetical protein
MLFPVRRIGGRRKVTRAVRLSVRRGAGWLGIDRNPLRRGTDRLEGAVRASLVLAAIAGGPLVAGSVGTLANASSLRQVSADRTWRQVNARLLGFAPPQYPGYAPVLTQWVLARWRAPSGAVRTGVVPVPAGAGQGSLVPVWVDGAGRATGHPPLSSGMVEFRVALAEVSAWAGLVVAVAVLLMLVRWLLNRHRLVCWALEWAHIGPRWTTRL